MTATPRPGAARCRRYTGVVAALLFALSLALPACGSSARTLPAQRVASPVAQMAGGRPSHVAVIVMENKEYGEVIGSPSTPFLNRLARHWALARQMYAISHPSLPNYLALTAGSTLGIDSDCTTCSVHATSIVDQLERARLSWRAYMEGLPHPCFHGGGAGNYAKRHDPFMYFPQISGRDAWCRNVVGLGRLSVDERTGALPRFVWITPDVCHDTHDCDTATGDRFLARLVPSLLRHLGPRGVLFLTWDEGSTDDGCCRLAAGGHIATIVAGPGARPGARLDVPVDHYSVLQTIEDLFGLPRLRGAACACTPSLAQLLRSR